jgi:hypothetical protein
MLVEEMQKIRELLETGLEYSINIDEKRSNAYGATYIGSGRIRGKPDISKIDPSLLKCPHCELRFKTDENLKTHIANWHK